MAEQEKYPPCGFFTSKHFPEWTRDQWVAILSAHRHALLRRWSPMETNMIATLLVEIDILMGGPLRGPRDCPACGKYVPWPGAGRFEFRAFMDDGTPVTLHEECKLTTEVYLQWAKQRWWLAHQIPEIEDRLRKEYGIDSVTPDHALG